MQAKYFFIFSILLFALSLSHIAETNTGAHPTFDCFQTCESATNIERAMCYTDYPQCRSVAQNLLSTDGTFSYGKGAYNTTSQGAKVVWNNREVTFHISRWVDASWKIQLKHDVRQSGHVLDLHKNLVIKSIEIQFLSKRYFNDVNAEILNIHIEWCTEFD